MPLGPGWKVLEVHELRLALARRAQVTAEPFLAQELTKNAIEQSVAIVLTTCNADGGRGHRPQSRVSQRATMNFRASVPSSLLTCSP